MIKTEKEQNGRPVSNYINNYIQTVSVLQLKGRDYQIKKKKIKPNYIFDYRRHFKYSCRFVEIIRKEKHKPRKQ